MKRLVPFLFIFFAGHALLGQVYNPGDFVVRPNENVYVQGDFVNQEGGMVVLNGTLHLEGDWYNNSSSSNIVNNSPNGLLRLVGKVQQTIGGSQTTLFSSVELDNPAGLALDLDADIRRVFTFTRGKVFTGSNYLIISDNPQAALVGYNTERYVVGNLRRYMNGTNPYDLPVGTADYLELANLKFNAVGGLHYVNVSFVQGSQAAPPAYPDPAAVYIYPDVMNPVANPLSIFNSRYSYIDEFLNYGYWTISPDNFSSGNFKMTLTSRGHTNGGAVPGQHALVRRANGSSPWQAQGIYPFNSQTGTGSNPVTAYMDQMTGFTHFILGKSRDGWGPLAIELLSFDAQCVENGVQLRWSTANEDNNDFFTIERSKDLLSWKEVARVAGQLNSSGIIHYEIIDPSPWQGLVYYRLKETDIFGYSQTYEEQWLRYTDCLEETPGWIKVFTDAHQGIVLQFTTPRADDYQIKLFDAAGRLVAEGKGQALEGFNQVVLTPPAGAGGLFFLRFSMNSRVHGEKLMLPLHGFSVR